MGTSLPPVPAPEDVHIPFPSSGRGQGQKEEKHRQEKILIPFEKVNPDCIQCQEKKAHYGKSQPDYNPKTLREGPSRFLNH